MRAGLPWIAIGVSHLVLSITGFVLGERIQGEAVLSAETISSGSALKEWDLPDDSGRNSTSHWIFDTVNTFLQHWTHTRLRNGHHIVPGLVPVGTLLYHGTDSPNIPTRPEWTATDPEHSYPFCRSSTPGMGCWQLTLVATRPLRVLYFDGSSAAKMWGGSMDTQDILIWGGAQPNRTYDEFNRINDLCDWGKIYNIDGYVRMEMDFEIMLCDFSSGVEPISFLNLIPAYWEGKPPLPKARPAYHVLEAGTWHNYSPGETRIKLDYSRILSFYDTTLFPGLQALRSGQERWDHNLSRISSDEIETLRRTLDVTLSGEWGNPASGVDWKTLFNVVFDRYAERLELLRYILDGTSVTHEEGVEAILKSAQRQMKSMLTPYILHSLYPSPDDLLYNQQWAAPVFEQCATTHVRYMERSSILSAKFTDSERLLLRAVKGVSKEICRVLVGVWAEGVDLGLVDDSEGAVGNLRDDEMLEKVLTSWKTRIVGLMNWLDWSYWVRCEPACEYNEMCYMPTWPFFKSWPPGPIPGWLQNRTDFRTVSRSSADQPGPDDDWYHPQPRCIRRIEPFRLD